MSQQLSPDSNSRPRPIREDEMRVLLRKYFAQDAEPTLVWELSRQLKDPFAESKDGRFRFHPLWLGLGTVAVLAFLVFVYFSFLR
jgi:hypothetical protein